MLICCFTILFRVIKLLNTSQQINLPIHRIVLKWGIRNVWKILILLLLLMITKYLIFKTIEKLLRTFLFVFTQISMSISLYFFFLIIIFQKEASFSIKWQLFMNLQNSKSIIKIKTFRRNSPKLSIILYYYYYFWYIFKKIET